MARGKTVFAGRCSNCHRAGGEGNSIGPDLTTIAKNLTKQLYLTPSLIQVQPLYLDMNPWLVNTKDGASVYGFLLSQNKQAIVIKDIAGQKHIIPLQKITSKEKQDKSLMPDPVANGLTEQNLADVAAFLLAQGIQRPGDSLMFSDSRIETNGLNIKIKPN
jgi:putative heme-binding domain-containing protein